MAFGKRRLGKKRVVRKPKVAAKPTLVKMMRKVALQTIHKVAENKITVTQLSGPSAIPGSGLDWNGTTGANGLLLPTIIPPIIQGSGTGAREGNKIEPRYLQIRGTINTRVDILNTSNAPFYVHMFIYRQRGNIFDSNTLQLLQGGTGPGTSLPFDGSLLRSLNPFNRDLYHIYKHRIFKMAYTPTNVPLSAGNQLLQDGWGNGFKMCHLFKQTIKIKKNWLYNDTATNQPTNDNMFVAFAIVNADGSVNATTVNRAVVNCESVLEFEDV